MARIVLRCAAPAGLAHRLHLVVERRPVAVEHMGAGDDDVDLVARPRRPRIRSRRAAAAAASGRRERRSATEATGMPEPSSALHRRRDHRRIDADRADRRRVVGEAERGERVRRSSGRRALAHRRRTRPGVSSPASVVRSMQVSACTSHAAWWSFLTERRAVRRRGAALDRAGVDARPHSNHAGSSATPGLRRRL